MSHQKVTDWLLLFQLETTCRLYRDLVPPHPLTPEERHLLGYCIHHLTYPPVDYLDNARTEILLDTHWSLLTPLARWLSVLRLCITSAIIDPFRWPVQKPSDAAVLVLSFPFNEPFSHDLYDGYTHYFNRFSTPLSIDAVCAVVVDGYKLWQRANHCA